MKKMNNFSKFYNYNNALTTGELYGNYSFGNVYNELLNSDNIKDFKSVVKQDLNTSNINHDEFKDFTVMDVGTGRQGLAMSLLGAKSVYHYDISEQHVKRFNTLIKNKYDNLDIKSKCVNLCKYKLPCNTFDFIYLNGVVQHFSDVSIGLRNCLQSVKKNGKIWLYFYRGGSFKHFVLKMIRSLVDKNDYEKMFSYVSILYGYGFTNNDTVSCIMDDLFVPYSYLFTPFDYIEFMGQLGFVACRSSMLEPMEKINHNLLHHCSVIVFKRKHVYDIDKISTGDLLKPNSEINYLDMSLYDSKDIKDSLTLYYKFIDYLRVNNNPVLLYFVLLSLHKVSAFNYYGGSELPPRYDYLQSIFKTAIGVKK